MRVASQLAVLVIFSGGLAIQALQHGSHTQTGYTSAVDPVWSGLNSSMEKMHLAVAALEPSRNSDVDFFRLMLPHHQAAIDMARTQLIYGKDPQMRRLAREILTDQQSEIEFMHLWLKRHESRERKGRCLAPPNNEGTVPQGWRERDPFCACSSKASAPESEALV
jgi:uncharacterized protein (DUF305 family)